MQLTKYYINEFGFSIQLAAFLVACFSLPGGVLRAIGGWISDRAGAYRTTWYVLWIMWVCFFFLSYPQTDLTISTVNGPMSFHIGYNPWVFTFLLFLMGIATAIGKASVFKFISDNFHWVASCCTAAKPSLIFKRFQYLAILLQLVSKTGRVE